MSFRFRPGDAVRVRVAYPHSHCRTPFYCRGKQGVVERLCGQHRNPQELAYGADGLPKLPLYRVRFPMAELWGAGASATDVVEIEIYEPWLEPAAAG
jgi:nitrile hydratase subunit beta